jgi:hypothetical protein
MRERLALIETEARKLARSGQHLTSDTIRIALLEQGFEEASKVLSNRWTQSELDRLCEQSGSRPAKPGTTKSRAS